MLRSHESCEPEVHEWKTARILSFLSKAELPLKTKLGGTYQSFHTVFHVWEMPEPRKCIGFCCEFHRTSEGILYIVKCNKIRFSI